MILLILMSISVIYSAFVLPSIIDFICSRGKRKLNYKGIYIPDSAGISFVLYIALACGFLMLYSTTLIDPAYFIIDILSLLTGVFSACLTGYYDDVTGDGKKGIKGHGTELLKMRFTSGGIKGLVGIITAFTISMSWKQSTINIFLNGLIICLMQNFINLLDLRPYRAIKSYILQLGAFLIFGAVRPAFLYISVSLLIVLMFYSSYEAREVCMMGDTGSNTLGILLGMAVASSERIVYKLIILSILILTQAYAEKRSISSLIERVRLLKFIDMIGRRK